MPRTQCGTWTLWCAIVFGIALVPATSAHAQMLDKKAISLAAAKKMVAAAEAEATKNHWGMCIAVVDEDGISILTERMDECQVGSIDVALGKARTAARYRRPSKFYEDAVNKDDRVGLLTVEGLIALEGGFNVVVDGKTIGAIGCSGATSVQDGQVCKAGLDAVTK
jgi:glc operon protein GlcG